MKNLDEAVHEEQFSGWLSPPIMDFLVSTYAKPDPAGKASLTWNYVNLGPRLWGHFLLSRSLLEVNKTKTADMFKQQVETILHEIQHWNQSITATADVADRGHIARVDKWKSLGGGTSKLRGNAYWNNNWEVDARRFAAENLEAVMIRIGKMFYSGKIEGGDIDTVVEELFDEYIDSEKPLTRLQIGNVLRDYDLNTLENMKKTIEKLRELEVKIVGVSV